MAKLALFFAQCPECKLGYRSQAIILEQEEEMMEDEEQVEALHKARVTMAVLTLQESIEECKHEKTGQDNG